MGDTIVLPGLRVDPFGGSLSFLFGHSEDQDSDSLDQTMKENTLIKGLYQRYVHNLKAELDTEALLLGQRTWEATKVLQEFVKYQSETSWQRSLRLGMATAFKHAVFYGRAIRSQGRVTNKMSAYFGTKYGPELPKATHPRASMKWPASHEGRKGPAPHKPYRNK